MLICSMPECQTTAGCKCAERAWLQSTTQIRPLSVAEIAEDAFIKAERVKMLEMMNTPTDYDERKKAFIELAEARAAAVKAQRLLHGLTFPAVDKR